MNIFKKLLKIGQAEIHALVEKMENPITLIEQGIRDLKEQLFATEEQYAQIRAMGIRTENEIEEKVAQAEEYEKKALQVLEKAKIEEIDMVKAETLAYEALSRKKYFLEEVAELRQQVPHNNSQIKEINNKLEVLKANIAKWEKELNTLKTKEKISTVSLLANKQMAQVDSNSTIEMLERLKNKTKDNEALAAAYTELNNYKLDKELNTVLEQKDEIKNELDILKQNLNLK